MRALLRLVLVLGAFALPLCALAQAPAWKSGSDELAPIPPLVARVTDLTSTLNAQEKQAIESKLAAWESQTGNQFAVLLVPSTQPEPIEAYSIRVAEAWKIGRKGQDNGVILVVAKNDRKLRIEVGYGFEGVLTDATSRRIIDETISPQFREGRFAQGINAGVDRVIGVIGKGEPLPAAKQRARPGGGINLELVFILLFVVLPILGGILRRIFGKVGGATVGAGVVGTGAWMLGGSLLIAIFAAVIAWIVLLVIGMAGVSALTRGGRRGGTWGGPWGGGGGGWGGGGGSWGGGGGGFGGGGASGNW